MINNDILLITVITIININSFLIGYLLGRRNVNGVINTSSQSFFSKLKDDTTVNNISIDDKKFVTDIKTDGLEKKYDSLGDTKTTTDNISNSVNKLKNLKR